MSKKTQTDQDILGAVTFGLLIILVAILIVLTPNIFPAIINFFTDFAFVEVYPGFFFWAPQNPANHLLIYNAIFQFFIGTLVINIVVLFLRIIFQDTYRRQVESVGGIIFSVGAIWAAYNLLINYTTTGAITAFGGYILIIGGISLVISSFGQWIVYYYAQK